MSPEKGRGVHAPTFPAMPFLSSDGFYVNFPFVGRKPELLCVGMALERLAWGHRGALHVATIQCRPSISAAEHRTYFDLTFKNFPFVFLPDVSWDQGVWPLSALLYRSGCLEGGHRLWDEPRFLVSCGAPLSGLDKGLLSYIKCLLPLYHASSCVLGKG